MPREHVDSRVRDREYAEAILLHLRSKLSMFDTVMVEPTKVRVAKNVRTVYNHKTARAGGGGSTEGPRTNS